MLLVIVSLYGPGQPSLLSKPHFPSFPFPEGQVLASSLPLLPACELESTQEPGRPGERLPLSAGALGTCPSRWVVPGQPPHMLSTGGCGWNVWRGSCHVNHYTSSG